MREGKEPRKPLMPPTPQEDKPKPPAPPVPPNKPNDDATQPGASGSPSGNATEGGEGQRTAGGASLTENATDLGGPQFASFYSLARSSEPWPLALIVLLVVLNAGAFAAAGMLIRREPGTLELPPRIATAVASAPVARVSSPRTKAAPVLARNVRETVAPPPAPKPVPAPARKQAPAGTSAPQTPSRVQSGAVTGSRIARNPAGAAMLIRKKKLS